MIFMHTTHCFILYELQKLRSELDHLMIESASSVSKGGKSAIDYQHLEEQLLEERRR